MAGTNEESPRSDSILAPGVIDANPWCTENGQIRDSLPFLDEQILSRDKVRLIQQAVDPKRLAQAGWATCELDIGATGPPLANRLEPQLGLYRPDEDGRRKSLPLGHDVQHPVHPVSEVDIGQARWAVQDPIALGAASRSMASGVFLPNIGLNLHNSAARLAAAPGEAAN